MSKSFVGMRRSTKVVFVALVGLMLLGSAAWACTYQPQMFTLNAQSGPRGAQVTATGQGVTRGGPVELRWNSLRGPLLAEAAADDSGSFSLVATIPDAVPDIYYVVAAVGDEGIARAAFQVTPTEVLSTGDRIVASDARGAEGAANRWSVSTVGSLTPTERTPSFGLGLGLLAVGSVAVFASLTAAVVGRSRRAHAPRD